MVLRISQDSGGAFISSPVQCRMMKCNTYYPSKVWKRGGGFKTLISMESIVSVTMNIRANFGLVSLRVRGPDQVLVKLEITEMCSDPFMAYLETLGITSYQIFL